MFICELARVTLDWFRSRPRRDAEMGVLGSVAQNLVSECRNDFQRSMFVLTSKEADLMRALQEEIERSHARLAVVQEFPLRSLGCEGPVERIYLKVFPGV